MRIDDLIRERGPITVAAFMAWALYDPEFGYYARASRRSGRAGDFFTSVDVGPLFGELIEVQLYECFQLMAPAARGARFDLVEAGAGNGRLAADILRAAKRDHRPFYEATRLHLVEASAAARAAQRATLADVADRLVWSDASLPDAFDGVLIANELFDALPVHQVVMHDDGLREVYVDADPALTTIEGPPSTPRLQEYLDRAGVRLQPGWRAEINLQAVAWIRQAAERLQRGFMILIDYGHEAGELYGASHALGTLTTFRHHRLDHGVDATAPRPSGSQPARPPWLSDPGERDITSHVDFSSLRQAAEAAGMQTLGFLDQTYFLMGVLNAAPRRAVDSPGALKMLLLPGGLGSTHKVLLLGKHVGTPALVGCSFGQRIT